MKKWIPLILIALAMAALYFSGLYASLDYETIRYHHVELTEYVNNNPILTPFMYVGTYIVATTLSIPGGLLLSLLGGYLFVQPWALLYVLVGSTTGATLLFLAAKSSVGSFLKKRAGPRLSTLKEGFNKHAASYLLFLRFIPLFPFWLVNLAPAFFNVRLRTYVWTTLVGIAPGAYITTLAGRGLNAVFETTDKLTFSAIFNKHLIIALILLGILTLVPVFFKKRREKQSDR